MYFYYHLLKLTSLATYICLCFKLYACINHFTARFPLFSKSHHVFLRLHKKLQTYLDHWYIKICEISSWTKMSFMIFLENLIVFELFQNNCDVTVFLNNSKTIKFSRKIKDAIFLASNSPSFDISLIPISF